MLSRLIIALADDDTPRVVALMHEAGLRTARMSSEAASAIATIYFDQCDASVTEGMNVQEYLETIEARDPSSGFPERLLMAARVSLLMRGLAMHLGTPVRVARTWRPYATDVLVEDARRRAAAAAAETPAPGASATATAAVAVAAAQR